MNESSLLGAGARRGFVSGAALLCLAQAFSACGQSVTVGLDDPLAGAGFGTLGGSGGASAGAGSGGGASGAGSPAGGEAPCQPTECRGKLYACGDCADNDEDGETDALDPACLGPCDDDETGLSTGLTTNAAVCRQDCYFDGDSGSGNDKCEWSQKCDPLSVAPSYPPSGEMRCAYEPAQSGVDCAQAQLEQPAACLDSCLPVVPNGCDCFGCCELPARSGQFLYVGAGRGAGSCSLTTLEDPASCPPCTPVKGCFNDCQPCEACVGTGPAPSCAEATCESGEPCGPGAPCGLGFYCITGCCVPAPVR